jgi:hypothetical protein
MRFWHHTARSAFRVKARFARDSPLEEGVYCELVSEIEGFGPFGFR